MCPSSDENTMLEQLIPKFDALPNDRPVHFNLTKGDISLLIRALMQTNHANDALISAFEQSLSGGTMEEITGQLAHAIYQKDQASSAIRVFTTSILYKILHGQDLS